MARLKIRVICTFAVGTSVLLIANLKNFLDERKVKAFVDIDAVTALDARGTECDIIVTEPSFEHLLPEISAKKVIVVDDFSDIDKMKKGLIDALKELEIPFENP